MRKRLLWGLAVVLVFLLLPVLFPAYWISLVTQMLIFGMLAMSLDLLLGYTGLPAFGHAGFFGVGAYVVGILSTRYGAGFWLSGVSALVLAVAIAALFGLLCVNTGGVYFLMMALALAMCLWGLAYRWVSMTGGDNGISGIPPPQIGLAVDLSDPVLFFYFTFLAFGLVLLTLYLLVESPFGQTLRGIRESESRMRVLGYNTWLHKYLSYVIAGGYAGIAGVFWAYYNTFVSPVDMDLVSTMEVFFMTILGGPGTLVGPALGAGIIVFLKNFISAYTQRWLIILGIVYVLFILFAPDGIVNFLNDKMRKRIDQSHDCGNN
jgi:branched-chain amino acid transport system permease protein